MAKKNITGLGSQAVSKFFEEQPAADQEQPVVEETKKNPVGRPQTIKREITKSSQEGLKGDDTRATIIVSEALWQKLKDYQNTSEYTSLKALINDMIINFLEEKGAN